MVIRVHTKVAVRMCFGISKTRIRVRSPRLPNNPAYNSIKGTEQGDCCHDFDCYMNFFDGHAPPRIGYEEDMRKSGRTTKPVQDGRRIMIVVDSSREAKGALQWALTHAVRKQDTVILLHVGSHSGVNVTPKAYGLLDSMKSTCQTQRPGVQVEVLVVQGTDKGPLIVEEAKQNKVSLLVLGHRRPSVAWRLFMRWNCIVLNSCGRVVDYCIQYADCMTIAVRRKSKKLGGYLITTKRHKNFWLLA